MKTTLTVLLIINLYGLTSCVIKEHYFINLAMIWDDALNHCRTYYHDLSTFIDATEEQQFVLDSAGQPTDAWVGLIKRSGVWQWTTGKVATQVSWYSGEPNNYNYNCALVNNNGKKLYDNWCPNPRTFFCMNMFEFFMIQQTESWEGALEYCRDHYDDLVSLNSSRRMDYALSKISAAQTQYVWIGLRFLAGGWFWISGVDVQYQVWSSTGQPQCPAQNQHCAALDKNTNTWSLRDCEEKLNFLCFAQVEDFSSP